MTKKNKTRYKWNIVKDTFNTQKNQIYSFTFQQNYPWHSSMTPKLVIFHSNLLFGHGPLHSKQAPSMLCMPGRQVLTHTFCSLSFSKWPTKYFIGKNWFYFLICFSLLYQSQVTNTLDIGHTNYLPLKMKCTCCKIKPSVYILWWKASSDVFMFVWHLYVKIIDNISQHFTFWTIS
jgi:hypothetical protein